MNTHKIVLVIQDLKVKGGDMLAIVSGDVHYFSTRQDKLEYYALENEINEEKDENKKLELQSKQFGIKKVASFQMTLDSNKEFKRHISSLAAEAIELKEKK